MKPGWKKSKIGIVFRGIPREDYSHCYEYMHDLFYKLVKDTSLNVTSKGKVIFPNYYNMEAVSRAEKERFKKEVNSWDQKWVMNDELIDPKPLKYSEVYGAYEVDPKTVPADLRDEMYEEYFRPTVGRYIKPKTKEIFGDIML